MSINEKLRLYLTPGVALHPSINSTLSYAKELHQKGRWLEAANHYQGVFNEPRNPQDLVFAYSGLAQELINYGAYHQANGILETGLQRINAIRDERLRIVGVAVYHEKKGWIDDNLCNPNRAIIEFAKARSQLAGIRKIASDITPDEIDKMAKQINSTAEHFLGRNRAESAKTSANPILDLQKSIKHFLLDLYSLYVDAAREDYKPANIGFQYSHLALSHFRLANAYNAQGNTEEAKKELQDAQDNVALAKGFFEDFEEKNPGSTIRAHVEMTLGMNALETESPNTARVHFLNALGIRRNGLNTGIEPYTKGYADAALAVALTYAKDAISEARSRQIQSLFGLGHVLNAARYGVLALCMNFGYTSSRILVGSP